MKEWTNKLRLYTELIDLNKKLLWVDFPLVYNAVFVVQVYYTVGNIFNSSMQDGAATKGWILQRPHHKTVIALLNKGAI